MKTDRGPQLRSQRYLTCLLIIICTFSLLTARLYAQTPYASFPSQKMSLADWGLTDPSQIGYMHVGILHKRGGDTLVVYDVRRREPVVEEPAEPRRHTPAFEGDIFLVSHFDQGNTNRLDGYFNGFAKSPSQSRVAISKAPDNTPALIFSYKNVMPSFAGFWIHLFDFKIHPAARVFLDPSPFTYLTFSIRGERGSEELLLQMADRVWERREGSLFVGDVASFLPNGKIENEWRQAWVPLTQLPVGLNTKELASLVFLVKGNGKGRIFVKDVAFTAKRGVRIPEPRGAEIPRRSLSKAVWLWETANIVGSPTEQQRLVTFCQAQGITDLFLQIPYEATKDKGRWEIVWDPSPVHPLISQLHEVGVKVHALDGDPRFALREWHGRVIATIQSIIQYNRDSPSQERFDAIRYDIEPYLLPAFGGVRKEAILKQYLSILKASQALAAQADLAFGVDIPYWFDERNEFFEPTAEVDGRPLSEVIIDIADNVGIMDYRTQAYGADGTIAHAYGELEYALGQGKKVFLGLETGELPDETDLVFGPASNSGSRILVRAIDRKRARLYWIPEGQWDKFQRELRLTRDVVVLSQIRSTPVPAAKLTFAEQRRNDLEEVMKQTASELHRFPSLHGFAIHSYESYRPWLERQTEK